MMQGIFLDTNIILDFLGERENFYLPSAKVMTLADKKEIRIFTTTTSLTNAFYILCKFEGQKVAWEKVRKFKLICGISTSDNEVVEKALNSDFKDLEDALQYFSAVATKCEIILTRNEKDFKNALIPVMDAESFLQTLRK